MTPEEIRDTLKEAAGARVCAKIKAPPFEEKIVRWLNSASMSGFRRKLAFAAMAVFFFGITGCKEDDRYDGPVGMVEWDGDHVVGDVEEVGKVLEVPMDSTEEEEHFIGDVFPVDDTADSE